jgi:hypothetical protein
MAKMDEKEWTLMFYFASDTPLAPEIVSQLKSLKQAGFHPEVNVIAQFDPNPENAETHIFDINRVNKIQADSSHKSKIGYVGFTPNDPYVVNLMMDKLWRNDEKEGPIRQLIIDSLKGKERGSQNGGARTEEAPAFDPPVPPPFRTRSEMEARRNRACQSSMPGTPSGDSTELTPEESLTSFLKFCSDNYPARHYILFILGHGVVVGNEHARERFLK